MPLSSATRLGPYEILGLIGAGGMGEVYKARDTRLDRVVAIKILPVHVATQPEARQRFAREARAVSALNHPNICTLHDIGEENGVVYIVTEFVDGQTLRQARPESLRRQIEIAAQVAEALAAAHTAKVVHRDLKPENIMVTRDGRAKILDFGLAKQTGPLSADDETRTVLKSHPGTVMGTVGYMSPEQARGMTADARSDIFSFGAVLYELVSGDRAFTGGSAVETLNAILKSDPKDLPETVPAGLQQIVRHCLEKEPQHRFQSANDLAFALRSLSGSAVTAAPRIVENRRRAWLAAVAGMAGTLAIGFVLHAWLFSPSYLDLASHKYTPVATDVSTFTPPAWSPDGKSVAYTGKAVDGSMQLFVQGLDSPTGVQLTRHSWEPAAAVFSGDGTRIYYLGNEKAPREVWSVSIAGGAPQQVLPALGGPRNVDGLAVSPDAKALVMARLENNGNLPMSIWYSSPPGTSPRKYPGSPANQEGIWGRARLRFSKDGRRLLAMVLNGTRYEFWELPWPPSPVQPKRLPLQIESRRTTSSADWMLDGRHLILMVADADSLGGRLVVADSESGKMNPVTAGFPDYEHPMLNPRDGAILVCRVREEEDAVEIPLDGSPPVDLVATTAQETDPAWSPVTGQFVYVTNRRGEDEIWLSSRKEGWHRPLVTQKDFSPGLAHDFIAPTWSPDGDRITYGSGSDIFVSAIAGGPATRLGAGNTPTWSPDGQWIAYRDFRQTRRRLMKKRLGSNDPPIQVMEASGSFRPAWSPDGAWITVQLPQGFGVVSPDGKNSKVLYPGDPTAFSAVGWSHDSRTVYLGYVKNDHSILSAFDLASGRERKIQDFGTERRFTFHLNYSTLLSEAPDGKTIATSLSRRYSDLWLIEGVRPPPGLWERLWRR